MAKMTHEEIMALAARELVPVGIPEVSVAIRTATGVKTVKLLSKSTDSNVLLAEALARLPTVDFLSILSEKQPCLLHPGDSIACPFCDGKGHWPENRSCEKCGKTGRALLSRVIASRAPATYVQRIADVWEGCEEDPEYRDRGRQILNVLRDILHWARTDCPERINEIFPDSLASRIDLKTGKST